MPFYNRDEDEKKIGDALYKKWRARVIKFIILVLSLELLVNIILEFIN